MIEEVLYLYVESQVDGTFRAERRIMNLGRNLGQAVSPDGSFIVYTDDLEDIFRRRCAPIDIRRLAETARWKRRVPRLAATTVLIAKSVYLHMLQIS